MILKKKCHVKADYIHNIFDNPRFEAFTFNENDGWKLSELFKSFYLLRDMAGYYRAGGAHVTSIEGFNRKNLERWKEINTVEIPAIMERILKMLCPAAKEIGTIQVPDSLITSK